MVDRVRHQHKVAGTSLFLLAAVALLPTLSYGAELPFAVGEHLAFNARWLWFDAGRVEATVSERVGDDGRKRMLFTIHAVSANTIASVFTLNDRFESDWDVKQRRPENMTITIRESTTKKDKTVRFDHDNGVAVVTINDREPVEKELRPGAQNFLTASYYTRTLDLREKRTIAFTVFEDSRNYDATMKVLGRSRIRVLNGEMNTIRVLVKLKFEGAFWGSSTMHVWLTDDEKKLPVKLVLDMWLGSIVITLVDYGGVDLDLLPGRSR